MIQGIGFVPVETRGRAPDTKNRDTSRKDALLREAAATAVTDIEAAIAVHSAYYGEQAIEVAGQQRRDQLSYLSKKIRRIRQS